MGDGLLYGIGSTIGGLFGYKGQKDTNVASAQQAQKQMDFQREMSNTAVQRRMADLKKAGINPILAGSKEASSPAGAMAPVGNKAAAASALANQAAHTALTHNQAKSASAQATINQAKAIPFDIILKGEKLIKDPKKRAEYVEIALDAIAGNDTLTESTSAADAKRMMVSDRLMKGTPLPGPMQAAKIAYTLLQQFLNRDK